MKAFTKWFWDGRIKEILRELELKLNKISIMKYWASPYLINRELKAYGRRVEAINGMINEI